jgi:hypothetical protein
MLFVWKWNEKRSGMSVGVKLQETAQRIESAMETDMAEIQSKQRRNVLQHSVGFVVPDAL